MDIAKALRLITNTLDDVEETSAFGAPRIVATFRASVTQTAVAVYVNADNTFTVGRSATPTDQGFLDVADAYARAAVFVRHAHLRSA
jgi:hypothetical protein